MRGADCGTEKNRRRRYLIDKPFQLSYLLDQVTVGLSAVIARVLALFFLVFVQLSEDRIYHSAWSETLFWDLALLLLLLLLLAVYRGVLRSHRIAGPAYRFRQVCGQLARGDFSQDFRLRRKDRLKDVAQALQEMTVGLRGLVEDDRRTVADARDTWRNFAQCCERRLSTSRNGSASRRSSQRSRRT